MTDDVTKVDFSNSPFASGRRRRVPGSSLIVATGATARRLGIESEEQQKDRGVSACATCDAAFFRDKDVYVVGGGDSAFEEALYLTQFAHAGAPRAPPRRVPRVEVMVDRAAANENRLRAAAPSSTRCSATPRSTARLRNTATADPRGRRRRPLRRDRPRPEQQLFVGELDHDENGYLVDEAGHRPRRTSPESSPPATCRTTSTARRSPPRARDAWQHSTPSGSSPRSRGTPARLSPRTAIRPTRLASGRARVDRPDRPVRRPSCTTGCPSRCTRPRFASCSRPHVHDDEPRPRLDSQGEYVLASS